VTAPTGTCPGCDTNQPLRRTTGTVRQHDLLLNGTWARCSGSGQAPKGGAR
jgi:hypothetical protein